MAETLPLEEFTFWTVQKGRRVFLIDEDHLTDIAAFLDVEKLTEAEIKATYGEKAIARTVVLKPNSYALKGDIARFSQRKDEKLGLVHDPLLVQPARAQAVVSSWNLVGEDGSPVAPTVAGFMQLPGNVAEYVDARIYAYLFPEVKDDPDFLAAWQRKRPPTEAKP